MSKEHVQTSTRAPPQPNQPAKQGLWQSILHHRRTVKLKKIEAKTAVNYNNLLIGMLAIIGIILIIVGTIVVVALHTLQAGFYKASGDILTVVSDHPAMTLAAYGAANGNDDNSIFIAAMLSELSAQGNVQGSFKGHWTYKTNRSLVKKDLTCIDEYTYISINTSQAHKPEDLLRLADQGCDLHGDVYRCPLHNCAMVEVREQVTGEFIPETITINAIDLGYEGIGK